MKEDYYQLNIILLTVFIGFIGSSLPYTIFAPLFLNSDIQTIIPTSWDFSSRCMMLGVALAVYPFGQFLGSPILGGCSDRYGRKFVLIVSLTFSALGHILSGLAITFNSLGFLLLSRFLTGIMEGNIAISQAIAADLKHISKEISFGRIFTIGSLGYILGPLLGGLLSDHTIHPLFSYDLPFYIAALITFIAVILATVKLVPQQQTINNISFLERFNLYRRLKVLFDSKQLKQLLIVSIIFTFGVDIFYEFGPAYLTILWAMTPAQIALYNTTLCVGLAVGSSSLPSYLFRHISARQITLCSMLITALSFILLVLMADKELALFWFFVAGVGIAGTSTRINIQISNQANKDIHGETMGNQFGLRMLGDSIICLFGGLVIATNTALPISISAVVAIISFIAYKNYQELSK